MIILALLKQSHRLTLGFDNPNYTAVFLTVLLLLLGVYDRLLSQKSRPSVYRWVVRGLEVIFMSLLVATASRGGLLAWCVGSGVFWLGTRRTENLGATGFLSAIGWRLITVIVLSIASGLDDRIINGLAGDEGISNRFNVWKGSLQLIAGSPWVGWGRGNSGLAYSQFVQDPETRVLYEGTVNSYLDLATQFGLPALALFLTVWILCIILSVAAVRQCEKLSHRTLLLGALAILAAISVAAFPTTIWVSLLVSWVIGAILIGTFYLISLNATSLQFYRALTWSVGGALMAVSALYVAGEITAKAQDWRCARVPNGGVEFSRNQPIPRGRVVVFITDFRALGQFPGKTIRRTISKSEIEINRYRIVLASETADRLKADVTIYFGARCEDAVTENGRIVLVCPPVGSFAQAWHPFAIFLPEYDELGQTNQSKRFSRTHAVRTEVLPGCGSEVSAQLATVLSVAVNSL